MKVVSYLNVIPAKNKSQEKTDILHNFVEGVRIRNDEGLIQNEPRVVDCDVAVIQGWTHSKGKTGAHLQLREKIIKHQIQLGKYVCTADSNLFLYANSSNKPHHYLRYSFNGVFPNTGIYFDDNIDPNRWQQISHHLHIAPQAKLSKGKYILLCCQRNGGWSMDGIDVVDWVVRTVQKIREYSDRPIVVRGHPGDKAAQTYLYHRYNRISKLPGVKVTPFGRPLEDDLHKCWAVVNHNSSSIVGPIIKGYPAYITDSHRSQCAEVAHHGFKNIESPQQFDREKWLQRISMFHWNFEELRNGKAWAHMRNYVQ